MVNPWIKFHTSKPTAKLRIFCFPYSGGTAQIFRQWSKDLPETVEVCPIEYPGHATRRTEPLVRSMDALIDELTPALMPELELPFVLYGHSLGGLIAFELARALRAQGAAEPRLLLVSGRRAPHLPPPHRDMHLLPDMQFLERVGNYYGGIPEQVLKEPDLLALLLPVVRADVEVYETYNYREGDPFDWPIAAYGGINDQTTKVEAIAAWEQHSTAGLTTEMFAGDHFFINTARDSFLAKIQAQLERVLP